MTKGIKVVRVKFTGTVKLYTYRTDLDLKVGDHVVVLANGEFKVVQVRDVCPTQNQIDMASKWIVQKVDTKAFEARMTKMRRAKELRGKLDELVERQAKMEVFKILAEKNPEAKALLAELEELNAE